MTQQQIARNLGISRAPLTNALQGRCGLEKSTAERLGELILSGTTVRQNDLFHPVKLAVTFGTCHQGVSVGKNSL